jgi:hypothetical protein
MLTERSARGLSGPWGGSLAALALCLLAGCHPATAADGASPCATPSPWRESDAKPGQPQAELAACLSDQAYQIRTLPVPVASAAGGIVAQCEIRVDRFEGRVGVAAPDDAADREAVQQATAAVTQYRQCAGR